MRTVYVIEEQGATWVFFDVNAWLEGIAHEVKAGFNGPGELLAYSGEIPEEKATTRSDGDFPDDACVDYVMSNVLPTLKEE